MHTSDENRSCHSRPPGLDDDPLPMHGRALCAMPTPMAHALAADHYSADHHVAGLDLRGYGSSGRRPPETGESDTTARKPVQPEREGRTSMLVVTKGRPPVRSASHGDEIVHGCETAQQAAGEPPLYAGQGAHRAWPGIEAAEPNRWTAEPIASGRSRCRSDHNPEQTPAALAPVRSSPAPRAHLLWAAALLLKEAIADDAPGDPDASALALERDPGLADADRVLLALICVSLRQLERRAGRGPADAALVSEVAGLLGEASRPAPPAGEPAWPCEPLTQSETRVLRYLPTHMGAPEIAAELYLSANTVRTHLRHLYRKLGAHSRQEAVQRARAIGLLTASYRRP
jgi:DNA-binding CsgD family transcriptional regulator